MNWKQQSLAIVIAAYLVGSFCIFTVGKRKGFRRGYRIGTEDGMRHMKKKMKINLPLAPVIEVHVDSRDLKCNTIWDDEYLICRKIK